jgi:hypothetical protein
MIVLSKPQERGDMFKLLLSTTVAIFDLEDVFQDVWGRYGSTSNKENSTLVTMIMQIRHDVLMRSGRTPSLE